MAMTYKNKAIAIAKSVATNEVELKNEMEMIDIMSPYHYVRYMNGEAEEGTDFLDADKHDGETWAYNNKKRTFVRVK